mmetsp:Transcript_48208/g.134822  ORF Transcript_48208/g.134822 Transcript_48208/m.134822 type:complete len:85 (-) Transcript_48208:1024-1278(-)
MAATTLSAVRAARIAAQRSARPVPSSIRAFSAAPELEEIEQPTFVERGKYFGPLEVVDGAYIATMYCTVNFTVLACTCAVKRSA